MKTDEDEELIGKYNYKFYIVEYLKFKGITPKFIEINKLYDFFHTTTVNDSFWWFIFYIFSGDRGEKEIEQLANTTGVVCDRVARNARGWSEEEIGDKNLAQVKTSPDQQDKK